MATRSIGTATSRLRSGRSARGIRQRAEGDEEGRTSAAVSLPLSDSLEAVAS